MITLLLAAALLHPNQTAALPAPVITELTNLSTPQLEQESPQSIIFNDGGLIGYFPEPQLWRAPVWTTPAAHPDVEHPWLWLHWIHEHRNDDCPPAPAPEPSTIALVATALLWCYRRR